MFSDFPYRVNLKNGEYVILFTFNFLTPYYRNLTFVIACTKFCKNVHVCLSFLFSLCRWGSDIIHCVEEAGTGTRRKKIAVSLRNFIKDKEKNISVVFFFSMLFANQCYGSEMIIKIVSDPVPVPETCMKCMNQSPKICVIANWRMFFCICVYIHTISESKFDPFSVKTFVP